MKGKNGIVSPKNLSVWPPICEKGSKNVLATLENPKFDTQSVNGIRIDKYSYEKVGQQLKIFYFGALVSKIKHIEMKVINALATLENPQFDPLWGKQVPKLLI